MALPRVLRGCSWDHPRGHAPMVATAAAYTARRAGEVEVRWTPRSLRDFGMTPVEQLAAEFDLIVMDHPHVGNVAESGCAVPFDTVLDEATLQAIGRDSPGRSHESYRYGGHQWGLAVDAACQVSAWRPDLIEAPPTTWGEVVELSRRGQVLWPLCDVDSAASLLTMASTFGAEAASSESQLVARDVAIEALALMRSVAEASDPLCRRANPITALEAMTSTDRFVYSPLLFCYISYTRPAGVERRVAYGPVPSTRAGEPGRGALLGGAGLVVSASSEALEDAVDYAAFVAGETVQRGEYVDAGGQPAHAGAWSDDGLDERCGHFFSSVAPVLRTSWTRPTWPAFADLQNEMIELFGTWWERRDDPGDLLDELDERYRAASARRAGSLH